MQQADLFFLIVLITVTATRIWLFDRPMGSPTIGTVKIHHYMYGIVLAVLSFFLRNLLIYSIGLGLIIDEAPLFLFPGASWKEYESKRTFTGILILLLFVFLFRTYLIPHFPA